MSEFLYDNISPYLVGNNKVDIPDFITNNLNHSYILRDYQIKSIQHFIKYIEPELEEEELEVFIKKTNWKQQADLLFLMATGSGKTLIMAATILYYYSKGYRNFLFFTRDNIVVDKTINDFIDSSSDKYLFAKNISINGKNVFIKEVDNFTYTNPDDINICFITNAGLHYSLKEAQICSTGLSMKDFKKVVLLADEAHHLDKKEWKSTVNRILKYDKSNRILRFTATLNLKDNIIKRTYKDKIIYNYDIIKFRKSGATKLFSNISVSIDDNKIRTLNALLLSQYRLKLFQDKINKNIKPVVLLKSKSILESEKFYNDFYEYFENKFSEKDIELLRDIPSKNDIMFEMFNYFSKTISDSNLVKEIKEAFSKDKSIILNSNSKNYDENIDKANKLEGNCYRLILTVDMLTEGWDVRNLFDIVRLYNRKCDIEGVGDSTISEAQIIGRGIRYCPYILKSRVDIKKDIRKFGKDEDDILKVCELLLFHSEYDSIYIDELNKILKDMNYIDDEDINNSDKVSFTYELKDKYKKKDIKFFVNKQAMPTYELDNFHVKLPTIVVRDVEITINELGIESINTSTTNNCIPMGSNSIILNQHKDRSVLIRILYYYFRNNEMMNFYNLKKLFPTIKSVTDFVEKYIYNKEIKLNTDKICFSFDDYCLIIGNLVYHIAKQLKLESKKVKGSTFCIEKCLNKDEDFGIRKKTVTRSKSGCGEGTSQNDNIISKIKCKLDLADKDWFLQKDHFGNQEEKRFVFDFSIFYNKIKDFYSEIYLLRNEKYITIYDFDDGRGFEPDFILILRKNSNVPYEQQQIFIEPKGGFLIPKELWKENFINKLKDRDDCCKLIDNEKYIIWGLPFYHNENSRDDEVILMDECGNEAIRYSQSKKFKDAFVELIK